LKSLSSQLIKVMKSKFENVNDGVEKALGVVIFQHPCLHS